MQFNGSGLRSGVNGRSGRMFVERVIGLSVGGSGD